LHDRIILQRGGVFVNKSSLNKRWRTLKEQPKMDNPEKLAMATYGRQDKGEKNKNTTQNVTDSSVRRTLLGNQQTSPVPRIIVFTSSCRRTHVLLMLFVFIY
jgi:hypothetical protein